MLPSAFRFFVLCQGTSNCLDDKLVTLQGVVNELTAKPGEVLELAAIVGAILAPEMQDKRLDLMAWRLGENGERLSLPGYAGTPLILPTARGPVVLQYSIAFQTQPSLLTGVYGFELFDRDGVFGPSEALLSTFLFGVHVLP